MRGIRLSTKRVQKFSPINGKPSINKVVNNLNQFLQESFIDGEYNTDHTYIQRPSKKNCKYCEFNQTEHCDVGKVMKIVKDGFIKFY